MTSKQEATQSPTRWLSPLCGVRESVGATGDGTRAFTYPPSNDVVGCRRVPMMPTVPLLPIAPEVYCTVSGLELCAATMIGVGVCSVQLYVTHAVTASTVSVPAPRFSTVKIWAFITSGKTFTTVPSGVIETELPVRVISA